jgi:hypothetical protein
MNIGDKGTISRGTHKGQTGEILAVDTTNEKYAVKFESGELATISMKAFKAPQEPSITRSELASALNAASLPANDPITAAVLDHLEKALPGLVDSVELVSGHGETADPNFN